MRFGFSEYTFEVTAKTNESIARFMMTIGVGNNVKFHVFSATGVLAIDAEIHTKDGQKWVRLATVAGRSDDSCVQELFDAAYEAGIRLGKR